MFIFAVVSFGLSYHAGTLVGHRAGRQLAVFPGVQTVLNYRRAPSYLLVLVVTSTTFLCGAVASVSFREPNGDWELNAPGAAFVLLGLFCCTGLYPILAKSIVRGRIELSTIAIRHRGWSFESTVNWSDVEAVVFARKSTPTILLLADPATSWQRRYTTRFWRIERLPPQKSIMLDCRQFSVEPIVLAKWLQTYASNPELTAGLAAGAAVGHLPGITGE